MSRKVRSLIVILTLTMITSCTSKSIKEDTSTEIITMNENNKEDDDLDLRSKLLDLRSQYMDRMDEVWDEYTEAYSIWQREALSTAEYRSLIINALNEYDKILNEIYQDLKKYLKEDDMEKITTEQLEWIKEKEEEKKRFLKELGVYAEADKLELMMTKERCEELVNYFIITNKNEDENNDVKKEEAIEAIINDMYNLLGTSKYEVEYTYRPDDNYVDHDQRKDYYIFGVNIKSEDIYVTANHNIVVNKDNYEVHYYYPDGSMKYIGNINN